MHRDAIMKSRRVVGIVIVLLVAVLHIVHIRPLLEPETAALYSSYFSDTAIPFAYYFLLCATENRMPWLRNPIAKAAVVVLLPSIAETAQYFGIPVLGSTFDPVDYCMYACGTATAVLLEWAVFRNSVQRRSDASDRPVSSP